MFFVYLQSPVQDTEDDDAEGLRDDGSSDDSEDDAPRNRRLGGSWGGIAMKHMGIYMIYIQTYIHTYIHTYGGN